MLLALQTTADGIDDSTLDGLTLVLLVGFVVSMVALSVVLSRRDRDEHPEPEPLKRPDPISATPAVTEPRTHRETNVRPSAENTAPAWLGGVTFPHAAGMLSEATSIIEQLLEARRARDLEAGIALYSPEFRARLATQLGVSVDGLERALKSASIEGDAPELRSVELTTMSADSMTIRAGYANRTAELYRLVRVDERWTIDSIERV